MMRYLAVASLMTLLGGLPALGAEAACPGEKTIKSASTEINTEVTFQNNSGSVRKVFWIDFEGARVHYGDIAPGAAHVQPTYLGHAWMISNGNSDCMEFYFAETLSRTVSLERSGSGGGAVPPRPLPPRGTSSNGNRGNGSNSGNSGNRGNLDNDVDEDDEQDVVDDGAPCGPGEYHNRSANICINTSTKARRPAGSRSPAAGNSGGNTRVMRCRPGFVQQGSRCVRQSGAVQPNRRPKIRVAADVTNEENRPDDLCGPGFTDVGGGCISNSLLKQN